MSTKVSDKARELALRAINPEDVKRGAGGFYYKVLCHECGWFGSSEQCGGGLPTGGDDYTDIECPDCESTCCEEPSELDIMALRKAYTSAMERSLPLLEGCRKYAKHMDQCATNRSDVAGEDADGLPVFAVNECTCGLTSHLEQLDQILGPHTLET